VRRARASGPAASGSCRSELFYAFLCEALREGIDESEIIDACLDPALEGHSIHDHVAEKGGRDYVKRQIEKAVNEVAVTSDGKQVVIVRAGDRYKAWRATERALLASKAQVFVRGGQLVEPLWRWEKTAQNRDVLVMSFVPYNVWRLSDVVARHAVEFRKYDGRSKKLKTIDPPEDVIKTILTRGDWMFPSVVGIVNTPTMRPDGTILDRPGYDATTQLWYKSSDNVAIPAIPERPTKEEALKALQVLEKLLVEFPFVDGASKSVALAGIMTPVLRGAFGTAPLFFLVAPNSGTGKSYLVKLISIIATGRPAPVLGGSDDPKEMEKRLSSAARKASPILAMTNLSIDLESDALNQMITDGIVEVRVFGKNELVECDCRGMTVFVDGNNIRLVGDLVRRALTATMNAKMERPETRTFKYDPVGLALADRGKYLAAIFTIARAYMAAREPTPDGATPLAGFEEWSRKIRYPLMWLGLTDPAESMEEARDLDPQRTALRELIAALARHIGVGTEFTAADVHQKILIVDARGLCANQDLFDVFSRDGRRATPKSIGNTLMRARDKVSDGRRIVRVKAVGKHANTYRVEPAEPEPATGGPAPETPRAEPEFDLAADPDAM
jgi:putative DNA primase/helicase